MLDVYIDYNPYTVSTDVKIDGELYTKSSKLFDSMHNSRLQSWIEPHGTWKGLFKELKDCYGENEVLIRFHGTAYDYADLEYANGKYGSIFKRVEMEHVNKDTCMQSDPAEKLAEIKRLYDELQNGPIEEFKSDEIRNTFESAINSDFEIVVVAPMSSGKSTLINAILGRDLLPALNQATTAVITTIRDNDNAEEFTISAKNNSNDLLRFKTNAAGSFEEDENGNYIESPDGKLISNVPATAKLIEQLNLPFIDTINDKGESIKIARARRIEIEGEIPSLPSNKLNTVFKDTPGGNNALNSEHEKIMKEAIENPNKSLILYIFNGETASTGDTDNILKKIATAMRESSDGKLSQDRFLFVANRMDAYDAAKEPYQECINNTLIPLLERHDIHSPNLFLVSAQAAKLVRMKKAKLALTKDERGKLAALVSKFGDMLDDNNNISDEYSLYKYSSINDWQKDGFRDQLNELLDSGDTESITEINSGVPALEMAIREYVEKYAICIKVNNSCNSFLSKVKERKYLDEYDQLLASSEEEVKRVKLEIAEKKKKHDESKELAEFRSRVESLSLNKVPILELQSSLRESVDNLIKSYPDEIKKDNAETKLRELKNKIDAAVTDSGELIVNFLNEDVIRICNDTIKEYQSYLNKMEEGGMFSLGGIDFKKLERFAHISSIEINDNILEDSKYITVREEVVGTRRYKKSGLFNGFKRFLGFNSGWGVEDVTEDIEYLKMRDFVRPKAAALLTSTGNVVDSYLNEIESKISKVKSDAIDKFNLLDKHVNDLYEEYNRKISDEKKLQAQVKANQENLDWMKDYLSRVENVLKIK